MPTKLRVLEPDHALLPRDLDGQRLVAKFFRALGDPSRLRILELLLSGEKSVGECVDTLQLTQSRVSSHLACLSDCGYVSLRRDGRKSFYSVADSRVVDLVRLATVLANENAEAVAACSRIDE